MLKPCRDRLQKCCSLCRSLCRVLGPCPSKVRQMLLSAHARRRPLCSDKIICDVLLQLSSIGILVDSGHRHRSPSPRKC